MPLLIHNSYLINFETVWLLMLFEKLLKVFFLRLVTNIKKKNHNLLMQLKTWFLRAINLLALQVLMP